MNWIVRMMSELEANSVAIERTKEYTETPTEVINCGLYHAYYHGYARHLMLLVITALPVIGLWKEG